jgi:hypothetical protein
VTVKYITYDDDLQTLIHNIAAIPDPIDRLTVIELLYPKAREAFIRERNRAASEVPSIPDAAEKIGVYRGTVWEWARQHRKVNQIVNPRRVRKQELDSAIKLYDHQPQTETTDPQP